MSKEQYWCRMKEVIRAVGVKVEPQRVYRDMSKIVYGNAIVVNGCSETTFRLPDEKALLTRYLEETTKNLQKGEGVLIKLGCIARYLIENTGQPTLLIQMGCY